MSETTIEFSHRFIRAVEGHPRAPTTAHGRQVWVRERLKKEAALTVSANTLSKWFNGTARPRPDNIRKIAKVLQVDEVWLAMGQTPGQQESSRIAGAERAKGAVLLVAGLVEMAGGRVTFPGKEQTHTDLQVNLDGDRFDVMVVVLTEQAGSSSCFVPEPVGGARILAVAPGMSCDNASACINLYDLTDVERQNLGGFSVIKLEAQAENSFKAPGLSRLLRPLDSVGKIADPE